ncbi:zinc-binding dehydrogenase [Streptomyces niveus]|uniref:zinc-binding dehydrogenase n=1 Tax=Streptomyces niveus TaxID=193462 RepID=UPI003713CA2F
MAVAAGVNSHRSGGGITEAAAAGRLRILVEDSYPLSEAAAAHRRITAGPTTGKIALVP